MSKTNRRRFGAQMLAGGAALAGANFPAHAYGGDGDGWGGPGRVYTSTNSSAGNELLAFAPQRDGSLALVQRIATQGLGTSAGLGSQGAVTLSGDGRHLFVVNAGSNSVSTFALRWGEAPALVSVSDTRGVMPTSVAEHDGLVYVLHAAGAGGVSGFRNFLGQLRPLADGVRGLSGAPLVPPATRLIASQVGFSDSGDALVVTERGPDVLTSWRVRRDGTLGEMIVTRSNGVAPFGFAFDRRDHLVVSEAAASTVSSYALGGLDPARPRLVTGSAPTTQAAACWVAIGPNGRIAYTGNAGTSSISSFRIDARTGAISLLQAAAGVTNGGASDLAVSADGRFLAILAGRSQQIARFRTAYDGMLEATGVAAGLPVGCVGIAAD